MEEYICNSRAFGIKEENEVAVILSNFSSEYIMGAIEDILEKRMSNFEATTKPNFVGGYEQSFKNMEATFPSDKRNILDVRDTTYLNIVNTIAKSFDLQVDFQEDEDKYPVAYFLFDFFISNYDIYLTRFFTNYIMREKDSLYKALALDDMAKSKDVTTSFNKNLFADPVVAVLAANLDKCIRFISAMDFTEESIFASVYQYEIVTLLCNHVRPLQDMFRASFLTTLSNPITWPIAATQIKFNLQTEAIKAKSI